MENKFLLFFLLLPAFLFAQGEVDSSHLYQFSFEFKNEKIDGYVDHKGAIQYGPTDIPEESSKIKSSTSYFEFGQNLGLNRFSNKRDAFGNKLDPLEHRKVGLKNIKGDIIVPVQYYFCQHLFGAYYIVMNQDECGKRRGKVQLKNVNETTPVFQDCLSIHGMKEGIYVFKDNQSKTYVSAVDSLLLRNFSQHKIAGFMYDVDYTVMFESGPSVFCEIKMSSSKHSSNIQVNNMISQMTLDKSSRFELDLENMKVNVYSDSSRQGTPITLTNALMIEREIYIESKNIFVYECVGRKMKSSFKDQSDNLFFFHDSISIESVIHERNDITYFKVKNSNNKVGLVDENGEVVFDLSCNDIRLTRMPFGECVRCIKENGKAIFKNFGDKKIFLELEGNYKVINFVYEMELEDKVETLIFTLEKELFRLKKGTAKVNYYYDDIYSLKINDYIDGSKIKLSFLFDVYGNVFLPDDIMEVLNKLLK